MNFTPGPWRVGVTGHTVWQVAEPELRIALCSDLEEKGGRRVEKANARLIAAAPDGLAAAVLALAWMSAPSAGPNEEFERLGEQFRRETGYARPGKDLAPADTQNRLEREKVWALWRREKQQAVHAALSAFVAKARGE